MSSSVGKWRKLRVFLVIALLLSTVVAVGFAAYTLQLMSVPLEVKEPFEILDYPTSFSLYPGENVTFDVTVQNLANVTYFAVFEFHLNDTEYQASYGIFSNFNYSVAPGTQKLGAWLVIASTAPPANLTLTVDLQTIMPSPTPSPTASPSPSPTPTNETEPSPSPTPSPSPSPVPSNQTEPSPSPTPTNQIEPNPSLELLAAGARWAARNGTKALYISSKDNWDAHHLTDGKDWGWLPGYIFEFRRAMILNALEQKGFEVVCAGDLPESLDNYSVVVLEAYYALEPQYESRIRQYVSNGGGVVNMAGSACYLVYYSKLLSTGTNLVTIKDWLGCGTYTNAGGTARVTQNNPFGTQLLNGDVVFSTTGSGAAAYNGLDSDAKAIAYWDSGAVFSFTHEYGNGRVYSQAGWQDPWA